MSQTLRSPSAVLGSLASLLLIVLFPVGSAAAQQPADSIRAEALRDYHGPDMTGKDGPLAKAGLDLLMLYHEHRAFQQQGGDTFSPSVAASHVTDGHVTVDAIAATKAQKLRGDLEEMGFSNAAVAGRIVSGQLPIDQIPALAKLESLRGVVLSRAETQGDVSRPSPMQEPPKAPETRSMNRSEKESTGGGAFFLLGTFAFLLLIEL